MNAPSERQLLAAERALKKKPRGAQTAVGGGIYMRLERTAAAASNRHGVTAAGGERAR